MRRIIITIIFFLTIHTCFAEIYHDSELVKLTDSLIISSFTGKKYNEKPYNFKIFWGTSNEFTENGTGYTTPDDMYGFRIVINDKIKSNEKVLETTILHELCHVLSKCEIIYHKGKCIDNGHGAHFLKYLIQLTYTTNYTRDELFGYYGFAQTNYEDVINGIIKNFSPIEEKTEDVGETPNS